MYFNNDDSVVKTISHNSISLPIYNGINIGELKKAIEEFNENYKNE